MPERSGSGFLQEGETCWRIAGAERAAVLVDGAAYFGALRASLLAAERRIVLAGWDIDSRTPIRGAEAPDDGAPEQLGALLGWLVERRPALEVRVLLWDYSLLYALEREPLPRLNLDWKTPRRVRVCLDNNLPFGSSHHEKLAVIDNCIAYCGGIDVTIRRWDRPEHAPGDPDRKDPNGEPYGPFHDLQLVVDGDAGRALAELVQARWNRAAGGREQLSEVDNDPWPVGVEPDFCRIELGIVRTQPAYAAEDELRQVETAYLRAIERAERLIYIENQYLTVDAIAAALADRLRARRDLELVIVTPRMPDGWLEEQTMGRGRTRFTAALADGSIAGRVRVLYPWTADGGRQLPVKVHAKLMVVDRDLLQLGSSNLNYRSMGVDRECDLIIEARDEDEREAIAAVRRRLLAHHLDIDADELGRAEDEHGSVIAALEGIAAGTRGLEPVARDDEPLEPATEMLAALADPERPIDPERFIGDLYGAETGHPLRRHLFRLLGGLLLIAAALLLWRFTPLADWADPERLGALLERIDASAWRGPLVIAAFVIGSFCLFPVTVLIAATAVALGPVDAFIWAFSGALLSAVLNYAVGTRLPDRTLERLFGEWIGRVKERVLRGGIASMMLVRNVPIAPFSVVNLVSGAAGIRLRDYVLGTALGMGPGIAALTVLGDRLRGVWQNPGWTNVGLLLLALAVWIGVALGLQVLSNRLADGR